MKVLILTILISSCLPTWGQEVFVFVVEKQKQKQNKKWSLLDFLRDKKTMKLQDQWLALNSSSTLFEMWLGSDSGKYSLVEERDGSSTETEYEMNRYDAGLYVTILGLEYQYTETTESYSAHDGRIGLRIFGRSFQDTNLTAFYGLKNITREDDSIMQQYWAARTTIYVLPFLGVEATYKEYLESDSDLSANTKGTSKELTGLLELWALRLTATWFSEDLIVSYSTQHRVENRSGFLIGGRFYF